MASEPYQGDSRSCVTVTPVTPAARNLNEVFYAHEIAAGRQVLTSHHQSSR